MAATEVTEMTKLAELLAEQAQLAARVDAIRAEERAAHSGVEQASAELVALERAAALGTKTSDATRRKAEDALLQAKTAAMAPWAERRAAATQAAESARLAAAAHAGQHLDALLADLERDGRGAADAVDRAAGELLAAYEERAQVEQRMFALVAMIRRPQPGDIERTRSEALAAEAAKLLQRGGETVPVVLVRPDAPRHFVEVPA